MIDTKEDRLALLNIQRINILNNMTLDILLYGEILKDYNKLLDTIENEIKDLESEEELWDNIIKV